MSQREIDRSASSKRCDDRGKRLERCKEGAWSRGCTLAIEAGKGRNIFSEASRRNQPCWLLKFRLWNSSMVRTNICVVLSHIIWSFLFGWLLYFVFVAVSVESKC